MPAGYCPIDLTQPPLVRWNTIISADVKFLLVHVDMLEVPHIHFSMSFLASLLLFDITTLHVQYMYKSSYILSLHFFTQQLCSPFCIICFLSRVSINFLFLLSCVTCICSFLLFVRFCSSHLSPITGIFLTPVGAQTLLHCHSCSCSVWVFSSLCL